MNICKAKYILKPMKNFKRQKSLVQMTLNLSSKYTVNAESKYIIKFECCYYILKKKTFKCVGCVWGGASFSRRIAN